MFRKILALFRQAGPPNHPFHEVTPTGLDYRGVPTAECPCGGRTFYTVTWMDDDYLVAGYLTDGLCAMCGALLTIATEIDHPTYERN